MEKPAKLKTLINPFPTHQKRHLKSQTFSTFIHFLSQTYCPKTGGDSNELGRTNEVHAETEGAISTEGEMLSISGNASCTEVVDEVEPVIEDRMETIEVDLGNRINKELVLETDGTAGAGDEILSLSGDRLCAEVVNLPQSVNKDKTEANEVDLESRRNKEVVLEKGRASNELEQTTEGCSNADGTTNMESTILSTNGDPSCLNVTKVVESVHEDTMETGEIDLVYRINKELCKETDFEIMGSLKKTKPETSVVSLATIGGEPQNSLVGSLLEDSEIVTQVDVDKEDHNCKLTEGSLSLDIDETVQSPIPGGNKEVRKNSVVESIQLQQMDLENSLSKCGLMDSPLCVTRDEEIEEGEIPGDFLIDDELVDFLFEEEQTSEPIASREEIANRVQTGTGEAENKYDVDIGATLDEVYKGVQMNIREKNVPLMSGKVVSESLETKLAHGYEMVWEVINNQKQTDRKSEAFNPSTMAVTGKVLAKMATIDQGDLSADKDAGIQKKRKRSPATQEKKAKKKKKQRKIRAENNRQSGVKRLTLQPMKPKPKPIQYCRHYLKGRCQKGDNCKFSHDTTPLTKSKPCCHFARNSCMKGDDCPYDHQLSKYPCSNFVTQGYCGRRTDCLFLHEVQRSEGSPKSINVPSSDVKESSLSWVMNPEKKKSSYNSTQKADPKPGFGGTSSSKSAEQKVVEIKHRAATPDPTGISKLLFGKSPLGHESKFNQAGTSSKTDSNLNVSLPLVYTRRNMASNSNGTSKVSHVQPKGVSFLSSGKSLIPDTGLEIDKQTAFPYKQAENLKLTNHASESKKDLLPNLGEMPKKASSQLPRGRNFLSFGKATLSNSGNIAMPELLNVEPKGVSFLSFGKSPTPDTRMEIDKQAAFPSKQAESLKLTNHARESEKDLLPNLAEMPKTAPSQLPRGRNFLSFGKATLSNSGNIAIPNPNADSGESSSAHERKRVPILTDQPGKSTPSSALKALLSSRSSSSQKALQATLAFAAKYDSRIK